MSGKVLFVVHPNVADYPKSVTSLGWKIISALALGKNVEVRMGENKIQGYEATQILIDEVS